MGIMQSIVILTGAGVSAESGLATFRASDGLWCNHRIEDVATPEGFTRDADLVHRFYNMRRMQLREVSPNPAHHALASLACEWKGQFFLVTQNVDDLHERAWIGKALSSGFTFSHMHGELKKVRCVESGRIFSWAEDLGVNSQCPCCKEEGNLRPHIVWFGEMPLDMEQIYTAIHTCDLFVSIGTSGNVYPAAGFVQEARRVGAHTVEINLEPSQGHSQFSQTMYGQASKLVPEFVETLLTRQS